MEAPHIDIDWARGAPTHAIGRHRNGQRVQLQQLIPFGFMATALRNDAGGEETNRWALVQVELAGYSSLDPWLPDRETQVVYASFMEFCKQELGIPETRPFPDTLEHGVVWATPHNPRRLSGKWGDVAGWWKHVEVPEGNDHWDDGSLQTRVMMSLEKRPDFVDAYQYVAAWQVDGHRTSVSIGPHFAHRNAMRAWAVRDERVRHGLWLHLKRGHRVRIAERRVEAFRVR